MPRCASCGGPLRQVHRRFYERLFCSITFACRDCDLRVRRFRGWSFRSLRFVCSHYTACIRCGASEVYRTHRKDRIDSVSNHPWSLLLQFLGAPRHRCPFCRLQYHDVRAIRPHAAAALRKNTSPAS